MPLPAALVAFSPGLDHTRRGATMITKEGVDPFFTFEGMLDEADYAFARAALFVAQPLAK